MKLEALSRIARATCSLALCAALAVQGVPAQAFAAENNGETGSAAATVATVADTQADDSDATYIQDPWYTYIDDMLAAGKYVEGQVLAAVSPDMTANGIERDNASLSVEELYETTGDQYELAFGLSLSDEVMQAADDAAGVDGDIITANDVVVKVLLVQSKTMTTRELLEAMAKDSRVIGATPDYYFESIDDDFGTGETTGEAETGTEQVVDGTDESQVDGETDADATPADDAGGPAAQTDADAADDEPVLLSADSSATTRATRPASFTPASAPTNITAASGHSATSLQWGFDLKTLCFKGMANGASLNESTFNSGAANSAGVIAIFDTGVDYTHPDLKSSFFDMTPYLAKTGGGKYGYNAVAGENSTDPMDSVGHGTHVAGIVAAQNNTTGTSGIANGAKLIAVKGTRDGNLSASAIYAGFKYLTKVAQAGVDLRVINCSWIGSNATTRTSIRLAICDLANKYGVVTVFASGNSGANLDKAGTTSTLSYLNPAVITVDSTSVSGQASAFSNYGKKTTTLFAPGAGILSTLKTSAQTQYLPTAMDHVVYKTFSAGESALKAQGPTGGALTATVDSAVSFDAQGGSMSLDATQLNLAKSTNGFSAKTRVTLSIPLGNANLSQLSEVGLAVNLTGAKTSTAWLEVAGANNTWVRGNGEKNWIDNGSWHVLSLNLYEAARRGGNGIKIYYDASGAAYIKVAVCLGSGTFISGSSLKVDAVGLGNQCWSFGYMSGTSMAAPAVSGLLSVYAYRMGTQYSGLSKAVRASKLANILRRTSVSKASLASLCATGGSPDASRLSSALAADKATAYVGAASYAVDSANSAYALCTISGCGFGDEQGTAEIAGLSEGTEVEVVSWSDDTVQLRVPRSKTATQLSASVTTTGGSTAKTGAISVLDTISAKDGDSGTGTGDVKPAGETAGDAPAATRGGTPATGDAVSGGIVTVALAGGAVLTLGALYLRRREDA